MAENMSMLLKKAKITLVTKSEQSNLDKISLLLSKKGFKTAPTIKKLTQFDALPTCKKSLEKHKHLPTKAQCPQLLKNN